MPRIEKKTASLFVRLGPALLRKLDAKVKKSQGEETRASLTRKALAFSLQPKKGDSLQGTE